MRILPWMLIVVIHSLTVWTCIAGLLGEYVIPSVVAYLMITSCLMKLLDTTNEKKHLHLVVMVILLFCSFLTLFATYLYDDHLTNYPFIAIVQGLLILLIVLIFCCPVLLPNVHEIESKPEDNVFLIKTILTSVWLPCIVG